MKIAILFSQQQFGGVEAVISKQMELLHDHGHEVSYYVAFSENGTSTAKNYLGIPLPKKEATAIPATILLSPIISKKFKKFDVLICHVPGHAHWIAYNVKKFFKVKYISYIHSPQRLFFLQPDELKTWATDSTRKIWFFFNKIAGNLIRKMDYISIVSSDLILVNSRFTAQRVEKMYHCRPKVLYPPFDVHLFKPMAPKLYSDVPLKHKLSKPLILSTGRVVPIKRIDWLIMAVKYVKEIFPSVTLAVTGLPYPSHNFSYIDALTKLANSLGLKKNVRFLGKVPAHELAKLYNAADVYAYSVPNEDLGMGPIESICCGTPAVVWNDGAGPCEIVIDGQNGFRARPYDIKDFAEKIIKAIEMDKTEMRRKAFDFGKNFSEERYIGELEGYLNKL